MPAQSRSTGSRSPGRGVHVPPEKRRIGYVAQEGSLFPHLSVADNVAFGLPRRRAPRPVEGGSAAGQRRPARLLRRAARRTSSPAASSSAWRWLARWRRRRSSCCSTSPSPRSTPRFGSRRARPSRPRCRVGATALLVTHDQSEALSMGARGRRAARRRLAQIATPEMLYRQPVDAAMARFVGEAVLLPGDGQGRRRDLRARAFAGRASRAGRAGET